MAEAIEKLTKHKEIELSPEIKQKLLLASASTIDKLLRLNTLKQKVGKDLLADEKPYGYTLT